MKKYLFLLLFTFPLFSSQGLGIVEKLGETVPLDLTFLDENAKEVTLKELMDGKPTLLTMNYFKCAGICTPQLNELAITLSHVELAENIDYKVLSVDFAEDETPALAAKKRKNILRSMHRQYVQDAWHFVIGENNSSGKLAQSVGFGFKAVYDENGTVDYIHGAMIVALSPTGKITRYLKGIDQLPADLTMAIKNAAKGTVSTSIPKNNSPYCFTTRPKSALFVNNLTRIAGVVTLLIFLGLIIYLLRNNKRKGNED